MNKEWSEKKQGISETDFQGSNIQRRNKKSP